MERVALQGTLDSHALARYVAGQLSVNFPDRVVDPEEVMAHLPVTLGRLENNFSHIRSSRYFQDGRALFDHLNTDQYCVFLYYLANTLYREKGDRSTAAKLYALNKMLNGIDLYFEVEMPDIFGVQHPVGTVVGRAKMSNYLFLYQRCTIGGNMELEYPTLGEGVVLFGDSAVIGNSALGSNTWVSIGAKIVNTKVGSDQLCFGGPMPLSTKNARRDVVAHFFR